jgi:hypothetical protein
MKEKKNILSSLSPNKKQKNCFKISSPSSEKKKVKTVYNINE